MVLSEAVFSVAVACPERNQAVAGQARRQLARRRGLSGGGRNRVWAALDVLDLLERFESGLGRRRLAG